MDDDGLVARMAAGDDTALREPHDAGAGLCAVGIYAAGLIAITVRGAGESGGG